MTYDWTKHAHQAGDQSLGQTLLRLARLAETVHQYENTQAGALALAMLQSGDEPDQTAQDDSNVSPAIDLSQTQAAPIAYLAEAEASAPLNQQATVAMEAYFAAMQQRVSELESLRTERSKRQAETHHPACTDASESASNGARLPLTLPSSDHSEVTR